MSDFRTVQEYMQHQEENHDRLDLQARCDIWFWGTTTHNEPV